MSGEDELRAERAETQAAELERLVERTEGSEVQAMSEEERRGEAEKEALLQRAELDRYRLLEEER